MAFPERTPISVDLDGGLDTKSDPKRVKGKLLRVENARYTSPGRIKKRFGNEVLAQTASHLGYNCAAYGGTALVSDSDSLQELTADEALVSRGATPHVSVSKRAIVRDNSKSCSNPTSANHPATGLTCHVWEVGFTRGAGSDAHYRIEDSSGLLVAEGAVDDSVLGNCLQPKVYTFGAYFLVLYGVSTGPTCGTWFRAYNTATRAFLAPVQLSTYADASAFAIDGAASLDNSSFVIVNSVGAAGGATYLQANVLSSTLVASGGESSGLTGPCSNLSVCQTYDSLLSQAEVLVSCAVKVGAYWTIETHTFDPTGSNLAMDNVNWVDNEANRTLVNLALVQGAVYTSLAWTTVDALGDWNKTKTFFADGSFTNTGFILESGSGTFHRGVGLASRPFFVSLDQQTAYALLVYAGAGEAQPVQATYFIARIGTLTSSLVGRIDSRLLASEAGPVPSTLPTLQPRAAVPMLLYTSFVLNVTERTVAGVGSADIWSNYGVDQLVLDFSRVPFSAVESASILHFSAGDTLHQYGGAEICEHGLHLYPENIIVPGATGDAHTYGYVACYETTDEKGNIYRSSPSPIRLVKTLDPPETTPIGAIQVPTLKLTNRTAAVSIVLYRTADIGATFYKVAVKPNLVYEDYLTFDPDVLSDNALTGVVVSAGLGPPQSVVATPLAFSSGMLPAGVNRWKLTAKNSNGESLTSAEATATLGLFNTSGTAPTFAPILSPPDPHQSWGINGHLPTGAELRYLLTAVTAAGESPPKPLSVTVPSDLWGEVGEVGTLNLSWSAVTGAIEYKLYGRLAADVDIAGGERMPVLLMDGITDLAVVDDGLRIFTNSRGWQPQVGARPSLVVGCSARLSWTSNNAMSYGVYGRGADPKNIITNANALSFVDTGATEYPLGTRTTADVTADGDTTGNSAIPGALQLYTTGRVMPNLPAPNSRILCEHRKRIFAVDALNPLQVPFSQEVIPGSPVEFNPDFNFIQVPPGGGDVTALASMDDKLVFFKRDRGFYSTGNGPDRTGQGAELSWAAPQPITGMDTGCVDARSVVASSRGILFKSDKGYYLLSRDLSSCVYIGADVEAYNDYAITCAAVVANANQIRLGSAAGVVLVYDYLFNKWSIDTLSDMVGSCTVGGLFYWLDSNGKLWRETPSAFLDDATPVVMRAKTSWLQFAGIQGYESVHKMLVIGSYKSPHALVVNLAYEFVDEIQQTTRIPVTSDPRPYQFRVGLVRHKAQAIQVELYDDYSGISPGEGFDLTAITFMVSVKRGAARLPAAKLK